MPLKYSFKLIFLKYSSTIFKQGVGQGTML